VTDALGKTTTTTYDAVGHVTQIADPNNNTTRYTYDNLDRLLTDTNQLGKTRSYSYDAVGNQIATTRPLQNRNRVRDCSEIKCNFISENR
jgi:YD repeat-containing protein